MVVLTPERRNIIIGSFVIGLAASTRMLGERSLVIEQNPLAYYLIRSIIILSCIVVSFLATRNASTRILKRIVHLIAGVFVWTGELFAPGYNIEYSQLVIFIPLIIHLPLRTQFAYFILGLIGFSIALYFGQSREIVIADNPRYFYNTILSIITSTAISAILSLYLRKKDLLLENMKVKYTGLGIHTSMIIHDIKNSLMVPYQHFSSLNGDPEAAKSLRIMEELIEKLQNVLKFHNEKQICNPVKVIKNAIDESGIETRGVRVTQQGYVEYLPISDSNLKSIISNIFENVISVAEGRDYPIEIVITYYTWGLRIEDNGPGFSQEVISKFKSYIPFSSRNLGNGLGLINSRIIIEMLGGDFRIYNRYSGGAGMRIRLPTSYQEEDDEDDIHVEMSSGRF